jgi:hypothetical protein
MTARAPQRQEGPDSTIGDALGATGILALACAKSTLHSFGRRMSCPATIAAAKSTHRKQYEHWEPPRTAAVLLVMRETVMRKLGSNNDLWDWGVILLLAAGGAIVLWASVWVMHSRAGAPRGEAARVQSSMAALPEPVAISRDGS